MPFTVTIDGRQLAATFDGMEQQLPFATARALNEVATAFQANERGVIQGDMTIRRPWVLQGIKINRGDFATTDNLRAIVGVDPQRDFLDKFEQGGIRAPRASKALSVPLAARSSPQSVVPNALRPRRLGFGNPIATKDGGVMMRGSNRTFIIQNADGSGVVLQRKSRAVAVKKRQQRVLMLGQRHDDSLIVLYRLAPRTHVPASLHFLETAHLTFERTWPTAFAKWWNEAVRTARGSNPVQGMALPAAFVP